jgi:hypothetical protein
MGEVGLELVNRRPVLRDLLFVGEQLRLELPFPLQVVSLLQRSVCVLRQCS